MINNFEKNISGEVTVIQTNKRLDAHVSDIYKQRIKNLIDQGKINIVLDMSKTEFMDSCGLACIVSRIAKIRSLNGDLRLSAVGAQVNKVLEITNLDKILSCYDNNEDAINSFKL
jgi:anti-anti-sigma factor